VVPAVPAAPVVPAGFRRSKQRKTEKIYE